MESVERKITVVFDLDDTLTPEHEYVRSGMRAVAALCRELYGVELEEALMAAVENNHRDPLGVACAALGSDTVREELLWTYRLHRPDIVLSSDVRKMLDDLEFKCAAVAILTDGRSTSQRAKLRALGLHDYPKYISQEWNSAKPEIKRFEQIMKDFPASRFFYVGDNPAKDFSGPNRLGWTTLWYRGCPRPVHAQSLDRLYADSLPIGQFTSWEQLVALIAEG